MLLSYLPAFYFVVFSFGMLIPNSLSDCFFRMKNNIVGMETNMEQLLEKVSSFFFQFFSRPKSYLLYLVLILTQEVKDETELCGKC